MYIIQTIIENTNTSIITTPWCD